MSYTKHIENMEFTKLADKYGLPLYIYDAKKMQQQQQRLLTAFCNLPIQLKYACKALSNINILKLFQRWGLGLDAVSIEETQLGLLAGFAPQKIIYTPSCISFEEIVQAVEKGVVINIDSLSTLEKFGKHYGENVPCCVRLNPNIVAGANTNIQTGHIDSKFGISIYQLKQLIKIVKKYNIKIIGLHMHTGSDILDANVFLQAAEILYEVAERFCDLQFLDFGSGFKVSYRKGDIVTDIEDLGQKISHSFKAFCQKYGKDLEIWFEPGKFLVSEAGYFLVKVNVVKNSIANLFVGVDSGQNHLLRPMFYNSYHEIVNISNPHGKPKIYNVVGYICEADTFAFNREIAEVREGDILCFFNAGAYGFSMSSNYNSRLRPAEVLVYKNRDYLIRKRESFEDLLRHQTIIEFP